MYSVFPELTGSIHPKQMKKKVVFLLCFIGTTFFAAAQQKDLKAQQILNGVSNKYKEYKSVQADFTIKVESAGKTIPTEETGTIFLKGDQYKLLLRNQEIISDNNTVWTYLKTANEVQINAFEETDHTISAADIFTLYEKDFLYAYIEEKIISGKALQIIELTPNDKNKPYFKVRLSIDKSARNIQSAIIFDKNGSRYTYDITKIIVNPPLSVNFFSFDPSKYPGIEVVDLR